MRTGGFADDQNHQHGFAVLPVGTEDGVTADGNRFVMRAADDFDGGNDGADIVDRQQLIFQAAVVVEKLGGIFVVGENDGGGNGKAGGGQPETEKKFPPQRCKTDFQPTEKNGRKNAADQKKGEKLFVKQVGGFRRIGFQRVQQHDFVDGDMIICHEIKADGIGHKKKRGQRFGRFRPQKQIAGGKKKQKNDQVDTDEVPAGAGDGIKLLQKNAVVGKKQQKGEQEVVCKRTD